MTVELHDINGSLLSLQGSGGFRKLFKFEADKLNLRGSIRRVPRRRATVTVIGDDNQQEKFGKLLRLLQTLGMIYSYEVKKQESSNLQYVPEPFMIYKSQSKHAKRGDYSDPDYYGSEKSYSSTDHEG